MSDGQAIWSRSQIITFPNYFYHDEFLQQQIKSSGLKLTTLKGTYYTEERRVTYNNTNPEIELDDMLTDTPPFVIYHLSKPVNSYRNGSFIHGINISRMMILVNIRDFIFTNLLAS